MRMSWYAFPIQLRPSPAIEGAHIKYVRIFLSYEQLRALRGQCSQSLISARDPPSNSTNMAFLTGIAVLLTSFSRRVSLVISQGRLYLCFYSVRRFLICTPIN